MTRGRGEDLHEDLGEFPHGGNTTRIDGRHSCEAARAQLVCIAPASEGESGGAEKGNGLWAPFTFGRCPALLDELLSSW